MSLSSMPAHLIEKSFLADIPKEMYAVKVHPARGGKSHAGSKRSLLQRPLFTKLLGGNGSAVDAEVDRYRGLPSAKFNVGGWVHLPFELRKPVSLCVVYVDRSGENAIIVEEMEARGASQVLLSGTVEIVATGLIQSIQLYCGGISDSRVHVIDLHLQNLASSNEKLALVS